MKPIKRSSPAATRPRTIPFLIPSGPSSRSQSFCSGFARTGLRKESPQRRRYFNSHPESSEESARKSSINSCLTSLQTAYSLVRRRDFVFLDWERTPMIIFRTLSFCIACFCALALVPQAFSQQVALTIDDLPAHGALPPGMTRADVAKIILKELKDAHAP